MGCVTEAVYENVMESDLALIESNHDVEMLKNGRYPWPLKKRILGDRGHLSNEHAAALAAALAPKRNEVYLPGTPEPGK